MAGRTPKRMGAAYSRKARKQAKADHEHRETVKNVVEALDGTGLDPREVVGHDIPRKTLRPTLRRALPKPAIPSPLEPAPVTEADRSPDEKRKPPIRYSKFMADIICQRIAEGEPLQDICVGDGMPTPGVVLKWVRTNKDFSDMYDEARTLQADVMADEMLGLYKKLMADDARNSPQYRVAADILAKQAEWRAPRKFGPKSQLEIVEAPKTADEIKSEITRLQEDLGIPVEKRIH